MPGTVALVLIGVVVAAVLYRVLGSGISSATFVVTIGDSGVELEGQVPGKDDADVRSFFETLELEPGARVWAIKDGSELRLRFRGVPDNLQQRVRNYVYN